MLNTGANRAAAILAGEGHCSVFVEEMAHDSRGFANNTVLRSEGVSWRCVGRRSSKQITGQKGTLEKSDISTWTRNCLVSGTARCPTVLH